MVEKKKFVAIDGIARRWEGAQLWDEITWADTVLDPIGVREISRTLWRWREGKRTYTRLLALEASLQAHPDTNWKEIGGGHVRLYSTTDGHTVCEI